MAESTEREWFNRTSLAEWLDLDSPRVIEYMDYIGTGPRRYRIGREWRYRRSDVEKWLESRAESAQAG